MVSYSRMRPAMSRAETRRAGVFPACAEPAREAGSIPVVLMSVSLWTFSIGPCRHGQGGGAACDHHERSLVAYCDLAFPLNLFMAVVTPPFTMASTASAAVSINAGRSLASAREKSLS